MVTCDRLQRHMGRLASFYGGVTLPLCVYVCVCVCVCARVCVHAYVCAAHAHTHICIHTHTGAVSWKVGPCAIERLSHVNTYPHEFLINLSIITKIVSQNSGYLHVAVMQSTHSCVTLGLGMRLLLLRKA